MLRQCVALLLVSSFLGLCSPVFAGDLTSTTGVGSGFGHPHLVSGLHLTSELPYFTPKVVRPSGYAFGLPQAAQPQAAPPPTHITRTGKIMEWVGIGLMGEGALTMGIGAAYGSIGSNTCAAYTLCNVDNVVQDTYLGIGAASLVAGAALF